MPPSRLSDEEIAHEVQNGDPELFGLLVERYSNKMMRYARKFFWLPGQRRFGAGSVF